ncbi:uncharacterized protein LOC118796421 [Megalops cyprinoides]|uniref:uncharacterized protein LOC118796421 n=1 Tax=Megalops cyprinoides TaxID=118141 RepID=UPI001864FCAF|nr:uncharacterized protein LOC118796421 [Megalops cyprinoides]
MWLRLFDLIKKSVASRYIRMACDVLSPRGETKHSCRRQWLSFCKTREKPSKLAVSQSNRFNTYFEGAAGLIHHHTDIIHFFSDPHVSSTFDWPNVIQESVADDANDEVIQALVCVIAIVYCKILGPYWQLLKSSAEYVYFHRYVHCLHQNLMQWSVDASLLLLPVYSDSNVFHQFPLQEKSFDGVFSYCSPENQHTSLIRKCLEKMMEKLAVVTETNLKDFLPGGVYCQDPAPETCAKLRTCQLSHLMSEYPYGHAYPYKCKRSDISAVLPTTNSAVASKDDSSILKRNGIIHPKKGLCSQGKTLSILGKPSEDADLKENENLQDGFTKNSILASVAKNGGPCTSKQDVDCLLAKMEGASHAQKREAIRATDCPNPTRSLSSDTNPVCISPSVVELLMEVKTAELLAIF